MTAAKGTVGIINMGNTCFAASVIQAIRAIPELSAYILKNDMRDECKSQIEHYAAKNEKCKEYILLEGYKDLLKTLFSGSMGDICRPAGFYEIMGEVVRDTIYEQFAQRIPNDAHEFTVFMLDQFHEAMKRSLTRQNSTAKMIPAQTAWYNTFEKSFSPLVDLTFGLEQVQCKCRSCSNISIRWEVFNAIKVGFDFLNRGSNGLDDTNLNIDIMLKNEMEHIETIEDYQCDACKSRSTVDIHRKIWKLPHTLIIVIRRFKMTGEKERRPVTISPSLQPSYLFHEHSPEPSRNYTYTPISYINHHGSHFGGHYTAAALNPINSEWYFYDDERVHDFNLESSQQFANDVYVIVYRKS